MIASTTIKLSIFNSSNLSYVDDFMILVVFHNSSGYVNNFIFKALATEIPGTVK